MENYRIDESLFETPEMGDFYLGAVDTEYLTKLDEMLNDPDKADARNAAFYTETPPTTDFGPLDNDKAVFFKATVRDTDSMRENGWISGDELIIPIGSLSIDGNTSPKAKKALEVFKKNIEDNSRQSGEALNDDDYMTVSLYGITANKSAKWAYEADVPRGTLPTEQHSVAEIKEHDEYIFDKACGDNEVLTFKKIASKWRQVVFSSGNNGTPVSSFRWCVDGGEGNRDLAIKAGGNMADILQKTDHTVYLMIDCSAGEPYSYLEDQGGTSRDDINVLKHLSTSTHGAINGYCVSRMEKYAKFTGTAYVKLDNKWCNLAKMEMTQTDDDEAVAYQTFDTDSNAFQDTYDRDTMEWADAFKTIHDGIDDRKVIQQKIFGKDWDSLKDWTVTIGDVTLMVPPTNITVSTVVEDDRTPLLRANGSMSKQGKRTLKSIQMKVYFYGEEGVNGYPYETTYPNGEKVTYKMNGLRALVSQFKFAPFLPIENKYINETLGVEAVILEGINVNSVKGIPKLYESIISINQFMYEAYMPELDMLCASWGCEENFFATSFNWPVFRYYYQRPIIRGDEFIDKALEFNSEAYNSKIVENRTTLQPMPFENSGIKFYVADEEYLNKLMDLKFDETHAPLTISEKNAVRDLAAIGQAIAECEREVSKEGARPVNRSWTRANDRMKEVMKEFYEKAKEAGGDDVQITGYNYNTSESVDSSTQECTIKIELRLTMDGPLFRDSSKRQKFMKTVQYLSKESKEFSEDRSFGRADWLTLTFTSKQNSDGSFTDYVLDTDSKDLKYLAFFIKKQQEYDSTNKDENAREDGWFANSTVASIAKMQFVEYPTGVNYVESIGAVLINKISKINLVNIDGASPQYLGGEDTSIDIMLTTTDKTAVAAFNSLSQYTTHLIRKYRHILPSFPVRIDCEFTRLLGVSDVVLENVITSTVEGVPGLYNIQISVRSMDRTLRQREAMAMIDAQNNSEDAYSNEQGIKDVGSYFDIQKSIAQTELYPDLELPTLNEMSRLGWLFTRYKFQDDRVYVDPDFYYLYLGKLMSQVIRESLLQANDHGVADSFAFEDSTGAKITAAASKFSGFTVTELNDEAKDQKKKIDQMKAAQEKLKVKELKENLDQHKGDITSTGNPLDGWTVCKDIKCMFMEPNYKKEYDSYLAQIKADAIKNNYYTPDEENNEYDLATSQNEVERVLEIDEVEKLMSTDEKIPEGKWVAKKLHNARKAAYLITDYLSNTGIPDFNNDGLDQPICERVRENKENNKSTEETAEEVKSLIIKATQDFFKDSEVAKIMEYIPINVDNQFLAVVQDIVYAAACAASADKEYTSKKNSKDWMPNPAFIGKKAGGYQDTASVDEVVTIEDGVKNATEFGVFNIKLYDTSTYLRLTGLSTPTKYNEQIKREDPVNATHWPLDPYYRPGENEIQKVEEYKRGCMSSIQYCTTAYLRLILYWLMRMLDKQIIPSFSADVMRPLSKTEEEVSEKADALNLLLESGKYLVDTIKLYLQNVYAIDAGKIWTASLFVLNDGDKGFEKRIGDKNYAALNSYIHGSTIPSRAINKNDTTTLALRKMVMALTGLGRMDEIETNGVKQSNNIVRAARNRVEQKYIEMAEDPSVYSVHSCHDMIVNDARGRMLRAFPTYYMCLIDEGRTVGTYKLHDNFYNNMCLSEIDVVKSRKLPADTAHIVMSNAFSTFVTSEDGVEKVSADATKESYWSTFKSIFFPATYAKGELENTRQDKPVEAELVLTPGTRIHLRMGYGSNAVMLPIIFNGCIAEINTQEVVEIVAQGDGVELTNPIMEDMEAHDIDNQDDFRNGSEFENGATPRQIMNSLLTTHGGWWAKFLHTVKRPDLLGRSPYGIYHFGNPDFTDIMASGEPCQNIFEASSTQVWEDNMIGTDEAPSITMDIFGKSPWDIANICKSVSPDHICAVAPFGLRSTLFIGAPRYYYAYDYTNVNGAIHEKRKPYQQFHFYYTGTDIIGNGIVATSRDMKTAAIGLYQTCESFNTKEQHKVGPLFADIDIYPEYQKTMIVDTQLLGKGVPIIGLASNAITSFEIVDSMFDDVGHVVSHEKIAWKMTASALRESMMDMYAGSLVVLGDPSVKPHDRIYIKDDYEFVEGQCLVKDVTHHMSVDQGYITTITPDCIVTVADRHETTLHWIYNSAMNAITPFLFTVGYLAVAKRLGATWGLRKAWEFMTPKKLRDVIQSEYGDMIKGKASEYYDKIKNSDIAKKAKDKITDKKEIAKEKLRERTKNYKTLKRFKGIKKGKDLALKSVGKQAARLAIKYGLKNFVRGAIAASGPLGWAIYAAFAVTCTVVSNLTERFTKNLEVTQVYPLKHYGRAWTAGLQGSKGIVHGSPTEHQQGALSSLINDVVGTDDSTVSGMITGVFKDLFLPFDDDAHEEANKLDHSIKEDDEEMTEDASSPEGGPGGSSEGEQQRNSFDDIIKGYMNHGNASQNLRNDFRSMMLEPRISYDNPEDVKNSYTHFAMLEPEKYQSDSKLQYNKCISDDARLAPYIKEGFLKIIHETPTLNTGGFVDSHVLKLNGEEKYIKVIQQTQKDNSVAFDLPMLNPDAINVLYEIVRRTKNSMPNANSSDIQETYEQNKNSFVLLESALRVGEKNSQAAAGFTFILRGVEGAAKPLATAISDLHQECIRESADNPMVNNTLFDSKDMGDNKTVVVVRMPKVSRSNTQQANPPEAIE